MESVDELKVKVYDLQKKLRLMDIEAQKIVREVTELNSRIDNTKEP